MIVDPIELVCEYIEYCRRTTSSFGLNEESLQHLMHIRTLEDDGEPFESMVFEYVTCQVMKTLDYPRFETELIPNDRWSQVSHTITHPSTLLSHEYLLNIYRSRRTPDRRAFGQANVFDLLASNTSDNEDVLRFYHGTNIDGAQNICEYSIHLHANHRLGSDFGPGFYITDTFDGKSSEIFQSYHQHCH